MTAPLPSHAEIVVIGGGIIGCSTAYHLARDHGADVVVLEQNQLTSGSTWHAAGLVGQLRSSASITQLLKYSVELYGRLDRSVWSELATGQDIPALRRELQREHINRIATALDPSRQLFISELTTVGVRCG